MSSIAHLWKTLGQESNLSGFRRYKVEHFLDFYVGFDSDGRHAFLIVCSNQPPLQSDMRSITVRVQARDDGKWSLFLLLDDSKLFDVFDLLCNDLVESGSKVSSKTSALKCLFSRLAGWRQLLEKGESTLLSQQEIRGLAGELLYLKILIQRYGEAAAVTGWVGPYRADQDFQINDAAWEVKTIRPGCGEVTIASERQLDASARNIVLAVIELASADPAMQDAFNINALAREVSGLLTPFFDLKLHYENLLFRVGYSPRSEYEAYSMILRDVSEFEVQRGFPALTASSLPNGVHSASFKLELSACAAYKKINEVG